jgi:hypothetical protein
MLPPSPKKARRPAAAPRNGRQATAVLDLEHDGVDHQHHQNTRQSVARIKGQSSNSKPTWQTLICVDRTPSG